MSRLSIGDKVYAYLNGAGYVGGGEVTSAAVPAVSFVPSGSDKPLRELPLQSQGWFVNGDDPDIQPLVQEAFLHCDGAHLRINDECAAVDRVAGTIYFRGIDHSITFDAKPWLDRVTDDALDLVNAGLTMCSQREVVLESGDTRAIFAVMHAIHHERATSRLAQELGVQESVDVGFSVELDPTELADYKRMRLDARTIVLIEDTKAYATPT
jgi:hypothetical protein